MKNTIFKYAIIIVYGCGVYACGSPDGTEPADKATVVRSAAVELGSARHGSVKQSTTRAVNESDPTLTHASDRTSHRLTITIGGQSGTYRYSSGSWIISETGVKFPGNNAADVELTLAPGDEDPVGKQDGRIDKLIDADILTGKLENQPPVTALPPVTLTHANALLDFEISGLSADDLNSAMIKIDESIVPYRPVAGGMKLQAIVRPGSKSAALSVDIGSNRFKAFISPVDGNLQANTRYTFRVVLEVRGLMIENVAVSQWAEGESGSGTVTEVP